MIVDLGGDAIDAGAHDLIVPLAGHEPDALPLARARNAGADASLADVLIFLDVDCIPTVKLIDRYTLQVSRRGGIWCGPVGYLPPSTSIRDRTDAGLRAVSRVHDGRPQFDMAPCRSDRYDLFWSLSFALARIDWERIGGFDERFVGYGGEDTDFARTAEQVGVPLWFDGFATAFHQHHPVTTPPVEHLSAIVRNSSVYFDKWGSFPMAGWLREFAEMGLIEWDLASGRLSELETSRTTPAARRLAASQQSRMEIA